MKTSDYARGAATAYRELREGHDPDACRLYMEDAADDFDRGYLDQIAAWPEAVQPDYLRSCREGDDAMRGIYAGLGLVLALAGGFVMAGVSMPWGAGMLLAAAVLGVAAYRVKP